MNIIFIFLQKCIYIKIVKWVSIPPALDAFLDVSLSLGICLHVCGKKITEQKSISCRKKRKRGFRLACSSGQDILSRYVSTNHLSHLKVNFSRYAIRKTNQNEVK